MQRHLVIEAVAPCVDDGAYAVKRVVGDSLEVSADIFRDGHEQIAAQLRLADMRQTPLQWQVQPLQARGNDVYTASTTLTHNTTVAFVIDAWTDHFRTYLHELEKKVEALLQVAVELQEGAILLQRARDAAVAAGAPAAATLSQALDSLQSLGGDPVQSLALLRRADVVDAVHVHLPRLDLLSSRTYRVDVDRPKAVYSTWYEMFVRSAGKQVGQAATLQQARARLPEIAAMGFDVLYLPPIHPIGQSFRKGPNNALQAGPDDPGCPWAIGGAAGGHDAIEPALGTLDDFGDFVEEAQKNGLEVALDFAVQCSPDHPWVKQKPEWFFQRPDKTIKSAENPPKKYEDVYPLNFDCADVEGLQSALLDILFFWIARGVHIFRVDNPHTKPFAFWDWAIEQVHRRHPDVLFLAEAFTRPKVMGRLAKGGFSQSYTYFTWRNTAEELRTYLEELTHGPMRDYFRPNFFVNTPDILPKILQEGGRAAFKMRLLLAATLSPTYGIYSGYELCENAALPNGEEYVDSEKYQVRVRDWAAPANLSGLITQLNGIRRDNVALQRNDPVTFFPVDNPNLLAYGRRSGDNRILCVVNLDPHAAHHGTVSISDAFWGEHVPERYAAYDLLDGATYHWGASNYVRLLPDRQPAHVLSLAPI